MENIVQFPKLGLEFTLHNSISIGPFTLTYYGMIIAFGLLLGLLYAFKNFRKVGVDPDKAIDCILGGIVGGIVGARLYYVIFSWSDYGLDFSSGSAFWESFSRIFKTWEGGMAIYGGLIGALLVGVLIARFRKINVKGLLDIVGIGFLIGQGIGRWGNFFNVEAFGTNTTAPWGMTSPSIVSYLTDKLDYFKSIGMVVDPSVPVHPCFLYESIWCLIGFVILALYLKHRKFDGEVFLMYLAYYGTGRFFIEGLRTDSLMIGTLRVSQVLAAVLVIASVLVIIVIRSKIKSNHDENYMKLFVKTEAGMKILNGIADETVSTDDIEEIDEESFAEFLDEDIRDEENIQDVYDESADEEKKPEDKGVTKGENE